MSLAILNELVDAIYVLWLPRYAYRRERLEKQLAGVRVEWVDGVDENGFTLDELRDNVLRLSGRSELNQGIQAKNLAIWLGQRRIREMIRERKQRAIVLEDDAWFLPDAARRLEHCWQEIRSAPINDDWRLIYLYRENPAGPIDAANYRQLGGASPFGYRPGPPQLPQYCNQGGTWWWNYIVNGEGTPETSAGQRELIVRDDGSILDHVYRAASERISTAAYAIDWRAVEAMNEETIVWTNDWWLARLTEVGHPMRSQCYCFTPCPVWPRP